MSSVSALDEVRDGRNLRRSHSYDRAVDAVLDLISEGSPSPTAQQIAERAGISVRTVFRLADDIESLHAAAVARQTERIAPLFAEPPADGTTEERVRVLVHDRIAIFETIAPVRRVGERLAEASPEISRGLARSRKALRAYVAGAFASELGALPGGATDAALLALDVAASWETWDQLRRVRGLSTTEAAAVVEGLLLAVLRDAAGAAGAAGASRLKRSTSVTRKEV